MPGVPSSKACGECRKQKKKCDQLTPSCSRCTRLGLECIGGGERRFKFVNGTTVSASRAHSRQSPKSQSSKSQTPNSNPAGDDDDDASETLACIPSSETTILALSLAEKFDESFDLRFHLSWTYGNFLEDIPRRIGANPALDASVAALVSAHSDTTSLSRRVTSLESLSRYSKALASLRTALSDPDTARQPETLCACYLLLITQGLMDHSSSHMPLTHTQGAAQILKARGYFLTDNEFEQKILLSLRGPVLLEALWNDKIQFTQDEWLNLVESKAHASTLIDRMMKCWAQMPELLRQGRLALQQQQQQQRAELLPGLIQQARQQYEMFLFITNAYKQKYNTFKANPALHTPPGLTVERMAHIYHRIYGLSLGLCLISSSIAQGLDSTKGLDLQAEALLLCEQVMLLAEEGTRYRPIGSGHMLICLPAAWSAAIDSAVRARLLQLYRVYASDLPGSRSPESVKRCLEWSAQRLRFQAFGSESDFLAT